jgi:hypothetical protein
VRSGVRQRPPRSAVNELAFLCRTDRPTDAPQLRLNMVRQSTPMFNSAVDRAGKTKAPISPTRTDSRAPRTDVHCGRPKFFKKDPKKTGNGFHGLINMFIQYFTEMTILIFPFIFSTVSFPSRPVLNPPRQHRHHSRSDPTVP